MSETVDLVKHIAAATTTEFNAHRYSQLGSVLTLERQNLFAKDGYYKEVYPFSLYRRSCMFLTARHVDEERHPLLSRLFGLNDVAFKKEVTSVAGSLRAAQSKITPILNNIEARAGLTLAKPPVIELSEIAEPKEPDLELIAQQIEQIYQNTQKALSSQQPAIIECSDDVIDDAAEKPRTYGIIGFKNITEVVRHIFNEHYKAALTDKDLIVSNRQRDRVLCRSFAMYTAAYCLPHQTGSYPKIGQNFGGRDHTTVLHAVNKIADKVLSGDPDTLKILGETCEKLGLSPLQQQAVMGVQKMGIRSWGELLRTINPQGPTEAVPAETQASLNEIAANMRSPALDFMAR